MRGGVYLSPMLGLIGNRKKPSGQPFTREAFDLWRTNVDVVKSNEEVAALHSYLAAESLRRMFRAAIEPVRVGEEANALPNEQTARPLG